MEKWGKRAWAWIQPVGACLTRKGDSVRLNICIHGKLRWRCSSALWTIKRVKRLDWIGRRGRRTIEMEAIARGVAVPRDAENIMAKESDTDAVLAVCVQHSSSLPSSLSSFPLCFQRHGFIHGYISLQIPYAPSSPALRSFPRSPLLSPIRSSSRPRHVRKAERH